MRAAGRSAPQRLRALAGGRPASRVGQAFQRLTGSPVGRVGSRALGGLGVVFGGVQTYQRARAGDTTGAVVAGVGTLGAGLMLVPFPPMQIAGAVIAGGVSSALGTLGGLLGGG